MFAYSIFDKTCREDKLTEFLLSFSVLVVEKY